MRKLLSFTIALIMIVGSTPIVNAFFDEVYTSDDETQTEETVSHIDEDWESEIILVEDELEEHADGYPLEDTFENNSEEDGEEIDIEVDIFAYEHRASSASSLSSAISGVSNGGTIILDADINYTSAINVSSKSYTINLNGFTLNVTRSSDDGISVSNGRTLTITGPGTLNVSVTGTLDRGISAVGTNSLLTSGNGAIVNASSAANDAVYAGFNGTVTITGNATGNNGGGVRTDYGGTANIGGNATSSASIGALATYNSSINVTGSVSGFNGAVAENGGTINVGGNATGSFCGAQAYIGGTVNVSGNAISTGTGQYTCGAMAVEGGRVFVIGSISGAGTNDIIVNGKGFKFGESSNTGAIFNRYYWDEYGHMGAYVYKRQDPVDITRIRDFVTRMYNDVLGRAPEGAGFDAWVTRLTDGVYTGAQMLYDFYFGEEFLTKGLSDEDFIRNLYSTMLDRAPDAYGWNAWISRLADGMRREDVLADFIGTSGEFIARCNDAGIVVGDPSPTSEAKITAFIARLYRQCLSRAPDVNGFRAWKDRLMSGSYTGTHVARDFLLGPEMNSRNLSNREFIDIIYNSMLGKQPNDEDYRIWVTDRMDRGWSRERVFTEVARSPEFRDICAASGIRR